MNHGIIKFIINNTSNEKVKGKEITATVFKNKVNFYCGCTGNTRKTATQMIYNHQIENIECPHCGKHADQMTQTLKEYHNHLQEEKEERERKIPLRVVEVNYDWETGIHYYALNKRIDYTDWKKVKNYFQYYTKHDWEDCEPTGQTVGWMTRQPEKVKEILNIVER